MFVPARSHVRPSITACTQFLAGLKANHHGHIHNHVRNQQRRATTGRLGSVKRVNKASNKDSKGASKRTGIINKKFVEACTPTAQKLKDSELWPSEKPLPSKKSHEPVESLEFWGGKKPRGDSARVNIVSQALCGELGLHLPPIPAVCVGRGC